MSDVFIEDTSIYWTNYYFYYFDNIIVHPGMLDYWTNCQDVYDYLFGWRKGKVWSYEVGGYTEEQWLKECRSTWSDVTKLVDQLGKDQVLEKNVGVEPTEKNYITYSFLDPNDSKHIDNELINYNSYKTDLSVRGMDKKDIELFTRSMYNSYDLGDSRDSKPLLDRIKLLLNCKFYIGSPCSWKSYAHLLNKKCYLTTDSTYNKTLKPEDKIYYLYKNY